MKFLACLVLVFAALTSACGDDDDSTTTDASESTGTTETGETGETDSSGDTGTPATGDELGAPAPLAPPSCDPTNLSACKGAAASLNAAADDIIAGSIPGLLKGDMEAQKLHAPQGFLIERVAVHFAAAGTVELHLWDDMARSWPTVDPAPEEYRRELAPPVTVTVTGTEWFVWTLDTPVFVEGMKDVWVGHRLLEDNGPTFAVSNGGSGDGDGMPMIYSQAQIAEWEANNQTNFYWSGVGDGAEYLVRLEGQLIERAAPFFADVTDAAFAQPVAAMRTTWADLDGDGTEELITHEGGYGRELFRAFRKTGATFTEITESTGLRGLGSQFIVFGDMDNDGDLDAFGGVHTPQGNDDKGQPLDQGWYSFVALNDGKGRFTPVANPGVVDKATNSAATLFDFDGDKFLDLYVGNWLVKYPQPPAMPDQLYKGNGDGTFTNVSAQAQIHRPAFAPCYGVTAGDYDNDGDMDLFVANYGLANNYLFRNDWKQAQAFTQVARYGGVSSLPPGAGGNTFSGDWGDIDNDGDLDLIMGDIAHPRYLPETDKSRLMRNDTAASITYGQDDLKADGFTNITELAGITYDEGDFDVTFVDFDNDGWLDVFISSLYPGHYPRLFRQEGATTGQDGYVTPKFREISYAAGLDLWYPQNHAWADYDNDGDLDLAIGQTGKADAHVHVYENKLGDENSWIKFKLVGSAKDGGSNKSAIGARITVQTGSTKQIREVKGGKGHFNSGPPLVQKFGLGRVEELGPVTVRWPSGKVETFTNLTPRKTYVIEEGVGVK
jgi:enediyne biosynthesis protein E4